MARMTHVLVIDGGGTKTAAALLTVAGETCGHLVAGPCNLYQDQAGGIAVIRAAWAELASAAGLEPGHAEAATCLSAGLAGIGAARALECLDEAFSCFAARRWSSDGYAALIGAFEGRPGALLSIGTGVVGGRLDATGAYVRLGGWGFPVGDRGGGAWLGLRLASDHLERRDGYGPTGAEGALWSQVAAMIGTERPPILDWLRAARPAELAGLGRLVVAAAATGDGYALALLDEAAGHLLRLARALRPSAAAPLCLGGGLATVFRPRLRIGLGAEAVIEGRTPDALHGAFLIGIGKVPPQLTEDRTRRAASGPGAYHGPSMLE